MTKALSFLLMICLTGCALLTSETGTPQTPATATLTVPTPIPTFTDTPTAPATATVDIKLFGFQPAVLEVAVGTTVTWTNRDDIEHSITSGAPPETDGTFGSDFITQGETFSYTFDTPGDYAYFCRRHNSMTGLIRVIAP